MEGAGPEEGRAAAANLRLARIDSKVAAVNRRLRMEVYMDQTEGAPRGFRVHYTDEAQTGANAGGTERTPSFDEQERLLRDIARARYEHP